MLTVVPPLMPYPTAQAFGKQEFQRKLHFPF